MENFIYSLFLLKDCAFLFMLWSLHMYFVPWPILYFCMCSGFMFSTIFACLDKFPTVWYCPVGGTGPPPDAEHNVQRHDVFEEEFAQATQH